MIRSGLIGRSILASRSPWLHEQEARAQGFDLRYNLFDFTADGRADGDLAALLQTLRVEGYAGFNVTFPFKQAIIPLLDELADSARAVGAVNTVAIREGLLVGHNTDMTGFRDALAAGLPGARLDRVLQIGAGGAGAAVANALLALGVGTLFIADLDTTRGEDLAATMTKTYPDREIRATTVATVDAATLDGVVNATPIGMASAPGTPIDVDRLSAHQWVADIVYFPLRTRLLQEAADRGCAVLDGSGMVIRQAALAFEIITGRPADIVRMERSFTAVPA